MALLDGPFLINTSRRDTLICWTTDAADSASSEVKIGLSSTALNRTYRSSVGPINNTTLGRYLHQVRVSGLLPSTQYFYTVGRTGIPIIAANNNLFFWTAPPIGDNSSKRRFWVIADGGVDINNSAPQMGLPLLTTFYNFNTTYPNGNNRVDGIISVGDNAYSTGTNTEFANRFFNNWDTLLRNTNLVICQGNHDNRLVNTSTLNSNPCWHYFGYSRYTEAGGIAPFNPRFYSWDYGNIHFISLDAYHIGNNTDDPTDSVADNSQQMRWLKNEIEFYNKEKLAGRKKWLIVICHFPAFSDAGHSTYNNGESYGTNFRDRFVPILNQGDVDLVIYGHDHNYYRTWFFHDYNGNSGTPFSTSANIWPPYVGSYGRGPNAAFPAATGSPYVKTNIYYGAVHVVQGNGNDGYYNVSGTYGGLMCCTTDDNNAIPSNFLNGNAGQFTGSGIIDIEPGIGTGGRDRLTYYHIRGNNSIVDYFQIDK